MTDLSTELAGLAAKATPGPWITAPDHIGNQDYETCIERPGNAGQIGAAIAYFHHDWETDRISWKAAQSNAALAVALRNNLPAIIAALKAAETPLGDVEPVAIRHDFDGYGWQYIDNGSGSDWLERHPDGEMLYAADAITALLAKLAERDANNKRLREALWQIAELTARRQLPLTAQINDTACQALGGEK